jgi:hypothetical protein
MTTISFIDDWKPALKPGTYTVKVSVSVTAPEANTFDRSVDFAIGGAAVALNPADIVAVFPPDGSLGLQAETLPHIMLRDPHLPYAIVTNHLKDAPWLAVLLVTDEELGPKGLAVQPFSGKGAPVETINLAADLLRQIAPAAEDLPLLTHVRELDGSEDARRAVVLCSRLPSAKSRNTALLVSLVDLFADGVSITSAAQAGTQVPIAVLARWSFSCVDDDQSFASRMAGVLRNAGPLCWDEPAKPPSPDPGAPFRAGGWSLLPFRRRDGANGFGLYRGAFVGARPSDRPDPADLASADGLLEFIEPFGIFDISYAAAWELGRLMALASAGAVQEIAAAQRRGQRASLAGAIAAAGARVPGLPAPATSTAPLPALDALLQRLSMLEDVSFAHLVPDPDLLPPESLRCFFVDERWVRCLMAGAISPGMLPHQTADAAAPTPPTVTRNRFGILLRSSVVADFPSLTVEGYTQRAALSNPLTPIRQVALSQQVLLVLFEQPVAQVDFHLHPEALHHGLAGTVGALNINVSDAGQTLILDPTHFRYGGATQAAGVLNIAAILRDIRKMPGRSAAGSGAFALDTVQSTTRASFGIDLPA